MLPKKPRINDLFEQLTCRKPKSKPYLDLEPKTIQQTPEKRQIEIKTPDTETMNTCVSKARHQKCLQCKSNKIGGKICLRRQKKSVRNLIGDHFNELIIDNLRIRKFESKPFL